MNIELKNISEWLRANKLSINIDKTNFILFHNNRGKDHLPLKLPTLCINDAPIKQVASAKFLGVQIEHKLDTPYYTYRKQIGKAAWFTL